MKTFRRFIRFLDRTTDIAAFLVCLLLFMIGMYSVYDTYLMFQEATDDTILKFKPGYEGERIEDGREILSSMAAWITIDGTTIDYPVMQGKDNIEFLNKDPFGEFSLTGSIFLDSRNSNDFTDYYSLIYGHHMDEGAMFGALDDFIKQDYLLEHPTGTLVVGDLTYEIRLYASFYAQATEKAIFSPTEFDSEVQEFVMEHAEAVNSKYLPDEDDRLIALSTCRFPESAERTIVIGTLSPMPK